jgi:hypothetical protein
MGGWVDIACGESALSREVEFGDVVVWGMMRLAVTY